MLLKIFLREQTTSLGPFALTILSVMIGVAAIVGIDIASSSALAEFARANRLNSGLATHQIVGSASGLEEQIYASIKLDGRFRNTAPVIEAEVKVDQAPETWQLLGIDPLSDYRVRETGLLDRNYEEQTTFVWPVYVPDTDVWPIGTILRLHHGTREQAFTVAGEILSEANESATRAQGFLITDIMWAQDFLKCSGVLSRIDLKLDAAADLNALEALLPSSVRLIDLETRHTAQKDMTRAFRTNLTALGYLTMLVAMFLIYSSTVFQIARRRGLLSQLRAIGITHYEITRILSVELLIIAVAGILLGVALGYLLSSLMLALVTDTINILYFELAQGTIDFPIATLLKAMALGLLGTAIAGAVPIREAGQITVQALSKRTFEESKALALSSRMLPVAAICIVLGGAVLVLSTQSLDLAFVGLFLLVLGPAASTPWLIYHSCNFLGPLVGNILGLVAKTAIVDIRSHLSRTGISVVALSLAVSASLGVALMIDSFRYSVDQWIVHYMRSDLYVVSTVPEMPYFSDNFKSEINALEGIDNVGYSTRLSIQSNLGMHDLLAMDTDASGFRGFMIQSPAGADLWQEFNQPQTVLISESLANRHQLSVGDEIVLPTTHGERPFTVIGVYLDYSTEHGLATMSWNNYERFFSNQGPTTISLALQSGYDLSDVKNALMQLDSAPEQLLVRSNRELRDQILSIFDQTFEITEILRWLTVFVAVIGMIFSLVALQLERTGLNARLKAVGFTRFQLAAKIVSETSITGLLAGMIAVPVGLMLCLSLVEVINVRSFGWTMAIRLDPVLMIATIGISTVAAATAGVYPAIRMWRTPIARGLRDE